jgi:hypothetical protein
VNEATLIEAAKQFKADADTYAATQQTMDDLELDVKLAVRAGFPPAAAEQARDDYRSRNWAPSYRARAVAARALCAEIGVSVADLKYAL